VHRICAIAGQLKRTCRNCATVWFVDAAELKGPSFGQLWDAGVGLGRPGKRSKKLRDLQRQSAGRQADLSRCPSCRFNEYDEQPS
jgi:hypothetical protein